MDRESSDRPHVQRQSRGRDHTGLCPFHKEKTPSFHVVEDKGFYHHEGISIRGTVGALITDIKKNPKRYINVKVF